jgi:hypothetical protein
MKECLQEFFTPEDIQDFEAAFGARIDLQYYSNRPVERKIIENSRKNCKLFFIKTRNALSVIREEQVSALRMKLSDFGTVG